MKGLSTADLRGNDIEELQSTLEKLRNDLFQAKMKKTTSQLENSSVLRKTRRDIARIETIINEKRRAPAEAAAVKE